LSPLNTHAVNQVSDTILGRGQFGVVVVGEWNGTPVALKTLENYDVDENEELFRKELKMMKDLHHPWIVQFLGWTRKRGDTGLQIMMEFLPGGSLEDYVVAKRGSVSLAQRVTWCGQMAQALAYLHNLKPAFLIHRDVKPSNFMLTKSLDVKLGDFGISRLFSIDGDAPSPAPVPKRLAEPDVPRGMARRVSNRMAQSFSVRSPPAKASKAALESQDSMEQTKDVGTTRYMAPEVHSSTLTSDFDGGGRDGGPKAKYSVQADVFSVGMVYFFVLEQGRAPRIGGASNPEEHFAALAQGLRPNYFLTKVAQRQVVDLCLRGRPTERPTTRELVTLFKGMATSPPPSCFGGGGGDKQKAKERANSAAAQKVMEEVKKREGVHSSFDLKQEFATDLKQEVTRNISRRMSKGLSESSLTGNTDVSKNLFQGATSSFDSSSAPSPRSP